MTDEKKETLSKDLAPAVQKMVSGHWQEAIPMLTAVVSTTLSSQLVGPILGPLLGSTAGGVASLLAGLLSSSAEKRMMSEDVRLQSESAKAKLVAEYVAGSLFRMQRDASSELRLLVNSLDEESALRDQHDLRPLVSNLREYEGRLGSHANRVEQLRPSPGTSRPPPSPAGSRRAAHTSEIGKRTTEPCSDCYHLQPAEVLREHA
jgi:hypothetical protein